jgi:hypothetical protein
MVSPKNLANFRACQLSKNLREHEQDTDRSQARLQLVMGAKIWSLGYFKDCTTT